MLLARFKFELRFNLFFFFCRRSSRKTTRSVCIIHVHIEKPSCHSERKTDFAEIIRPIAEHFLPDDTLQPRSYVRVWKIARSRAIREHRMLHVIGKPGVDFFGEEKYEIQKKKKKKREMQKRNAVRYVSSRRRKLKSNSRPRKRPIDHHPPLRPRSLAFQFVLFVPAWCAFAHKQPLAFASSFFVVSSPLVSCLFSPTSERNRVTIASANHVGVCSRAKKMPAGVTEGTRSE